MFCSKLSNPTFSSSLDGILTLHWLTKQNLGRDAEYNILSLLTFTRKMNVHTCWLTFPSNCHEIQRFYFILTCFNPSNLSNLFSVDVMASVQGQIRIVNRKFKPAYNNRRSLAYFKITQTIIIEVQPCIFYLCYTNYDLKRKELLRCMVVGSFLL
jgi:hypothetical protein